MSHLAPHSTHSRIGDETLTENFFISQLYVEILKIPLVGMNAVKIVWHVSDGWENKKKSNIIQYVDF